MPVIGTLGLIPIHESNLPSTLYNFWVGDTDFTITEPVQDAIEKTDGVETLDIFTRYRFRLGIGRSFEENLVKRRIDSLFATPDAPVLAPVALPAEKLFNQMKHFCSTKYKSWAIFQLENKRVEIVGGETQAEVEAKGAELAKVSTKTVYSWEAK